jgi:hypothetical protein
MFRYTAVVISLLAATSGVAQDAPDIPSLLHSARDGKVLWVSEAEAFDGEGNLRADRFSDAMRARIDAGRAMNGSDECRMFSGTSSQNYLAADSPETLERNARVIISGEVTQGQQGFFAGRPGTLFTVRVKEKVKGSHGDVRNGFIHLFLDDARMQTAKGLICARSAVKLPLVAGAKVLFFVNYVPFDTAGMIYQVDPKTQLIVSSAGKLHVPPAFGRERADSFDEVVSRVRSLHRARVTRETGAQ